MTFEEALKQATKEVVYEPHILLELSYSTKLVLPYKEGVSVIENLRKAEIMTDSYSNPLITPIAKGQITFNVMSHQDYGRYKVAGLLGITYDEACQMEKAEQPKAA